MHGCRAAAPRVDAAIERMQRYLLAQQNTAAGHWETRRRIEGEHYGHTTALVTLALLKSGVPYQYPPMKKALTFLRERSGGDPYTVYPRMLCWGCLPDSYHDVLERDAKHLLGEQEQGLFYHDNRNVGLADHRATLYALVALNAYVERGGKVSDRLWQQAADHFIRAQGGGGGWAWTDDEGANTNVSATVAALSVLNLCRLRLADYEDAAATIQRAIDRGERYLGRHFELRRLSVAHDKSHSFGAAFHDLYLLERLTHYSGRRSFDGTDWFRRGAKEILAEENGSGSIHGDLVETAFALLVLGRIAHRSGSTSSSSTTMTGTAGPATCTP